MSKRFFKRYAPDHKQIREHKYLRLFGTLLHEPNLWHLNRRSVSGAFAIGLFWAFIPFPGQMIGAAGSAILARVNLPIAVALVWITNPITIPPMFYFAYLVGNWLMGVPVQQPDFEPSVNWFMEQLSEIWLPLLLGSMTCALVSAALGYFTIRMLWRLHIVSYLKKRRERKRASITDP